MSTLDSFKELTPKLWDKIATKFTNKTKAKVEIVSLEYSQTVADDVEYERALIRFKCKETICAIGIQLPSYVIGTVQQKKKDFNTVVKSVTDSMIKQYNTWLQNSTIDQVINDLPKQPEGNKE